MSGQSRKQSQGYETENHTLKTAPPATGQAVAGSAVLERRCSADALHVGGVKALRACLDLELDFLSLGERLEAIHRDRGEVHEDVLASFLFNEAVPLGIIEPLSLSLWPLRAASNEVNRSCTTWCWARHTTCGADIGTL